MDDATKEPAQDIQAVVLAGRVMTHMASKMSNRFDSFSTWLLAGFGAGITLLLDKHDEVSAVPLSTIKFGVTLFLFSAILVVAGKYLSIIVGAATDSAEFTTKELNDHFKKQRESNLPLAFDLAIFNKELVIAMLPTHRWLVVLAIKKVSNGDFSQVGKMLMWLAQMQGILLFAEVVLFLWSIARLIHTLPIEHAFA